MKKIISICLILALLLGLCACDGNFEQVDLKDTIEIPKDGILKESTLRRLRDENAIGVFAGESNGFSYEWTIFGSDISTVRSVNLLVEIEKDGSGILLHFSETEPFGFSALLSVHLNEKWDALGATAYCGTEAVYSVSLTGSRTQTILNFSLGDTLGDLRIVPDAVQEEETTTAVTETTENEPTESVAQDDYLSAVTGSDGRVYSDGTQTGQDKYQTDPIPEGKPMPVEPEDQQTNTAKTYTCTFSIECSTILNHLDDLKAEKLECVPSDGVILPPTTVTFYEGESVFDVLQRVCRENGIHMESSWTPIYNSAYIEGIANLYEFDCGSLSGWMYRVNGWYPNYGCSRYQLAQGDTVEWRYTCDLGNDVGCDWMAS